MQQETNPHDFSSELSEKNQRYNNIVKPIARLMKAWNCKANRPFASFELEQIIASMDFSNDNYESGFFYAIDQLPYIGNYKDTYITSLKSNANRVKSYLESDNQNNALNWLRRILPIV